MTDIDERVRDAELRKLEAERIKLELEADEVRQRLKPLWQRPRLFAQLFVGGIAAAALLAGWGIDYAADVIGMAKSRGEFLALEKADLEKQRESQAKQIAALTAGLSRTAESVEQEARAKFEKQSDALKGIRDARDKLPVVTETPKQPPPARTLTLRTRPRTISNPEVYRMIAEKGFNVPAENIIGEFVPQPNAETHGGEPVAVDGQTGLMWQQGGSERTMTRPEALAYVAQLNSDRHAGFADWRLPTLEEVLSLMTSERENGILYFSKIFDDTQRWITTADNSAPDSAWGVVFYEGRLYIPTLNFPYWVRAVRTRR